MKQSLISHHPSDSQKRNRSWMKIALTAVAVLGASVFAAAIFTGSDIDDFDEVI